MFECLLVVEKEREEEEEDKWEKRGRGRGGKRVECQVAARAYCLSNWAGVKIVYLLVSCVGALPK